MALVPEKADQPIVFKDFNFKLAIINELMYGESPVLPPFSLNAFISGYTNRAINSNAEGFTAIPEVLAFFDEYEVDEKYASLVTSLYLDGGNQLYHEISPLWDGETPLFDISDFSDISQFTNLKEIHNELFPLSAEQKNISK